MLTEQFLNLSAVCLLNEKVNILEAEDCISEILTFYENQESMPVPLDFKNKFECIKNISKMRKDHKPKELIIDSILTNSRFSDLKDFFTAVSTKEFNEDEIIEMQKQIFLRKKLIQILKDYPDITKFTETFNNNMFDDLDHAVNDFEGMISKVYTNLNEIKRKENCNKSEELDFLNDDYNGVLEQIEKNYSGEGSVSSGYPSFDKFIKGGFQPKRVYIFGGASGDGKSTLMLNFLNNNINTKNEDSNILDMYIYVTMENHIDESLSRLYACATKQDEEKILMNWNTEKTKVKKYFKDILEKNNTAMKMIYFPASRAKIEDILNKISDLKNQYQQQGKKIKIKAVYIDYLDLMKSGISHDLYRIELGQITIELKLLSIVLGCPIISPTQVNRCLGLNTKININNNDTKLIKNLNKLDKIENDNGYVEVLKKYKIEKMIAYKIKTKSGKEVICSSNHIWPTTTGEKTIQTGLKIGDKLYVKKNMNNLLKDEIISIDCIGEQNLIDIKVGGNKLFFANNILTHNSGYDKGQRKDLTMVGESIKKVEHADFIGLLSFISDEQNEEIYDVSDRTKTDDSKYAFPKATGTLVIDIGKNRSGVKNRAVYLRADFAKYLVEDRGMNMKGLKQIDIDEGKEKVKTKNMGGIL